MNRQVQVVHAVRAVVSPCRPSWTRRLSPWRRSGRLRGCRPGESVTLPRLVCHDACKTCILCRRCAAACLTQVQPAHMKLVQLTPLVLLLVCLLLPDLCCRLGFLERFARQYESRDKCIQTDDLPGGLSAAAQFPSIQVGGRMGGWVGAPCPAHGWVLGRLGWLHVCPALPCLPDGWLGCMLALPIPHSLLPHPPSPPCSRLAWRCCTHMQWCLRVRRAAASTSAPSRERTRW